MKKLLLLTLALALTACNSDKNIKEQVSKVLKENPDVFVKAIEENPVAFMEAIQNAAKSAQSEMAKKRDEEEKKKLEEAYSNPLKPNIESDRPIRGSKSAPLVLVEYSDFECPFCSRGFNTVQELREEYGDKIQFIYKHLPLDFHKAALISAQYFEAIALQNADKAFKFHDEIFNNQRKLKSGEKFLQEVAKSVGADMAQLKKDLSSKKVMARIEADQEEAHKFGMQGTPGFLLNGVPVKGAYPKEHFVQIVEELKKRGKVNL